MGKLPWYFEYFVHSCRYNPSVDFIIFSDDASYPKEGLPSNVHLQFITLQHFSQLASSKLDFQVDVKSPYKLCDFKPAYGLLFGDLITDYDFWGHGDIDVILGNIRSFMTYDVLAHHDLISVRHDFLTGYFQLFRNEEKMNTLFMRSKDYQKVMQSDVHFCFDETNFQFAAFAEGKSVDEVSSEIESMMHVVRRAERENHIRAFFDFLVVEGIPGHLKWSKGTLLFRRRFEILLYHMIHFKKKYTPRHKHRIIPDTFTISTNRIYHHTS